MAIQSNFPAIKPSLLLDFANTKQLDPRITFTRGSTATYYDGVTTAKAEENLVIYSEQFDNVAWVKSETTITANAGVSPDGTTTADRIVPTTVSAGHSLFYQTSVSGDNVQSVYVKADGYNKVALRESYAGGYYAAFDLSTATVLFTAGCTATITSVGNSWYRLSMAGNITGLTRFSLYVLDPSYTTGQVFTSWAANGTSGVYLWGAQLEQRSAVTAYTATTTQPITNYIPVLQTAASGVARFDNNPTTGESLGLLIEEARTNLQVQSQYASGWTSEGGPLTANTVVAPDGTLTGAKVVADATTTLHKGYPATVGSLTTATTYTATVFMKAAGYNYGFIRDGYTGNYVIFDLSAGTVSSSSGATGAITSVGNGWYRCSAAMVTSGTNFRMDTGICSTNAQTPSTAWLGNGFSGIYIWGAQFEAGAFATSYIPTVASTVTRNADQANMTGTNFSSWYNQAEGSLYVDMTYDVSATFIPAPRFYLSSSPNTNSTGFYNSNTNTIQSSIRSNAVAVAEMSKTVTLVGNHKMSMGYKINDAAFTVDNTAALSTATPATLPLVDSFGIGGQWVGYFQNPATVTHIKKIAYYPIRVSNANILALTS